MKVTIDNGSGFCGGVIRAISCAEEFLNTHSEPLFSLGSIVHNNAELSRLHAMGMQTVSASFLERHSKEGQDGLLAGQTMLIRAHGEPPSTYEMASRAGVTLIDCTCPVVLRLQQRIREADSKDNAQILIFGKKGHAEVLGLMGQARNAIVIPDKESLLSALDEGQIRTDTPIEIFSQTTKDPQQYEEICALLRSRCSAPVNVNDTICKQVSSRRENLRKFARTHDVLVFVSGQESSNGKVLSDLCKNENPRTYNIESASQLRPEWFRPTDSVGVCGATSTPGWLLDDVQAKILEIGENFSNFVSENDN